MLNHAKKFAVWAVLAAWLASSGLTWDLLQVVAWVNMSRANAVHLSTSEAITKTLTDKPCPLCKVVQNAKKTTEQLPMDKSEVLKAKIKYDFNYGECVGLISPNTYDIIFRCDRGSRFWQLVQEVPVPPPKV